MKAQIKQKNKISKHRKLNKSNKKRFNSIKIANQKQRPKELE